ncbi:hypothetical protein NPIL_301881 [Nephila pilipes]|uniref:Uncharacterized protein n=1 Tax=Nephila pilipes TaxID=299642 RepID=A0A8X6U115_NEPPI|nr:hypothetical protein NPIL_301881 [Nephila pilipes]
MFDKRTPTFKTKLLSKAIYLKTHAKLNLEPEPPNNFEGMKHLSPNQKKEKRTNEKADQKTRDPLLNQKPPSSPEAKLRMQNVFPPNGSTSGDTLSPEAPPSYLS